LFQEKQLSFIVCSTVINKVVNVVTKVATEDVSAACIGDCMAGYKTSKGFSLDCSLRLKLAVAAS